MRYLQCLRLIVGVVVFFYGIKKRVLVTEVSRQRNFRRTAATCGWPTWKEAPKTGTACAAAAPLSLLFVILFHRPPFINELSYSDIIILISLLNIENREYNSQKSRVSKSPTTVRKRFSIKKLKIKYSTPFVERNRRL